MHPDRYEPSPLELRDRAIQERNLQLTASQEVYRRLLREVSWAIQSIRLLGELGSGLGTPQHLPISSEREAWLREFVQKITTAGYSPHDLDLATLQDVNPQDFKSNSSAKGINIQPEALDPPPSAMDVEVAESDKLDKPTVPTQVLTPLGHHEQSHSNPGDTKTQRSIRRSPELLTTPQPCYATSSKPGPSREGKIDSTNQLPPCSSSKAYQRSPSATNHHAVNFSTRKPPVVTRASSFPLEGAGKSATTSRFTSLDYASQLPPVPAHIIASRLLASQAVTGTATKHSRRQAIRSGLWIGPGSSEITKLGIKAQHSGVKSVLRKNCISKSKGRCGSPKFHNVLTTADWKTMLDELQTARALEVLERLKAEKAWSYTQIKKPRTPPIPKAHWDHLLDEMSWLQVDFRQERRWKIATAHRIAKLVSDWHQADPIGRRKMQVKVSSPRLELSAASEKLDENATSSNGAVHQTVPPSNPRPSNLSQLSSEVALGHHASPSHSIKGSPESFRPMRSLRVLDPAASPTVEKHNTTSTEASQQASPLESRKALHQIKRTRIPIFEMAPEETLIGVNELALDGICCKPPGYMFEHVKLQKLFVDLPLFGDLDSRPDKRPDEASPYLGRIARVAPFLEVKPLLVSTLQPSRNCQGKQWRNLGALSADDVRESPVDHKLDSCHHHNIFSGRKSKESKEPNSTPLPSPAPNRECCEEVTWGSSDEEFLKHIAITYEFNWKIVADVFNANLPRAMRKPVTAWDCYNCWMRLHLTPTPAAQHDTSTLPPKTSSVPNASGMIAPTSTLQPDHEIASTEPIGADSTDEVNGCQATKRPAESLSLFPNKRAARDDALQDISRKLKEKRDSSPHKPTSPLQPRQIVLTAHETHTQAIRPYMTPLEMSALKAERDRQTQAALEMAKRQQQMHQESLLQQARAAAVVAAAAQLPMRNASNKPSTQTNGNIPSRLPSQPTAGNFTPGRHNGLPGVTLHRQASQTPTLYVTSPPHLSGGSRGTVSPMPPSSHQARQSVLKSQNSTITPVSSQPPVVPQVPNIPQGFRPQTPNSQSPATGSSPVHHTPNGSASITNGLHNTTISHSLTPVQVAQYLQQQHLHQQRSPERQIHQQQHQQILAQQQMQQHFQHTHQGVPQAFGHQSPPHPHANVAAGAAGAINATSPLTSSSSPLPQPPL